MPAFPGPPLADATPEAWLAYADFLQEDGAPEADWLQALRFAEGLRRRPRLVLVGITRDKRPRGTGMLARLAVALDWLLNGGDAPFWPPRPRPVAPPSPGAGPGAEGGGPGLRPWEATGPDTGWCGLTLWQWVTPRGLPGVAGKGARRHRLAALGTTPGELPGLVEARPDVAMAFFRKAAEGLRVELREGVPWLSVKLRAGARQERPYFGGA